MSFSTKYPSARDSSLMDFAEIDDQDDRDLEYIPDQPDFIDGDYVADGYPTNEVHSGELPSEQDPSDKVEIGDDGENECGDFEIILDLPESGDMTDLIENRLMASRREALWGKKEQPWQQVKDPSGKQMYGHEAEASFGYNVFDDPNVQKYLADRGLTQREIGNFRDIRKRQLDTAKEKAYKGQPEVWGGIKETPEYSWGQGMGVNYNVRPTMTQGQQTVYNRMSPQKKKELSRRSPAQQQKFWSGMQSNYPQYFKTAPQRAPKNLPTQQAMFPWAKPGYYEGIPLSASRSLKEMRNHANLVGGLLAMPRTAHVIRQTADLVSAVRELDDGKPLDETTRSALRNTSRNLLTATDHLKSVNNRIANRVAGEIEQLYVDALSN